MSKIDLVKDILEANIKLHSIRQGHGVFTISSFETIARQIVEALEPFKIDGNELPSAACDKYFTPPDEPAELPNKGIIKERSEWGSPRGLPRGWKRRVLKSSPSEPEEDK